RPARHLRLHLGSAVLESRRSRFAERSGEGFVSEPGQVRGGRCCLDAEPVMSAMSGVFVFAPCAGARRARCFAPFWVGLALVGGCKINAVATPFLTSCMKDIDCGGGAFCTNGTCIPRSAGGTWAIEMLPTSDSPAVQTQLAAVSFSDDKPNVL